MIVGTPGHWHALAAVLACQAGKDVYVEKPLATSIQEGRAMITSARKCGRIVQVGTQQKVPWLLSMEKTPRTRLLAWRNWWDIFAESWRQFSRPESLSRLAISHFPIGKISNSVYNEHSLRTTSYEDRPEQAPKHRHQCAYRLREDDPDGADSFLL